MKKLVLISLLLAFGFLLKSQSYGDIVKIKHVLTNTHLHSHPINYNHPQSSGQQQVTAYGWADDNDFWIIKPEHGNNSRTGNIQNGSIIRLEHYLTHRNLHSHGGIPSPLSGQQEVTCFGENGTGDSNDNWRIEIEGGGAWSSSKRIKLIHVNTNYALHSHAGFSHPVLTANQQEVTCFGGRDDNDWWRLTEIKPSVILSNLGGLVRIKPTSNFTRTLDRTPKVYNKKEGKEDATTDGTGRFCTSQKVSFENGDFEALITRGIKDKIYPGAFYQLNSVVDGSFEPYNVARAPMELRIDLAGASATNLRQTVPLDINKGNVDEGISRLLNRNTTRNSCEIFYYKERIQSEEQLNIAARAEFSGWGADVQAQFSYNKQEKKDFYLVRFVQRYFTVSVNTTDPKTLFQNRNTTIEGDPVYISSVDYGRIGMLKIETNESEETIMAALNASYSNGAASGSGQFRMDYSRALQNARFTLFIYGGNAEVGARGIGGIQEFDNFVKQGALYDRNTAITPISYRMSFLKDGKAAYVNTTTEYTEQSCKQAQYLKIRLCGVSVDNHGEGVWGYTNLEVWELDSRGNKTRQVFPVRVGETTQMWSRPKENRLPSGPYPQTGDGYAQELTNVGVEWEFYVDPGKMSNNQILLVTKCKLEAEHKDNDFASVGWHGMRNEETRETRLGTLLGSTQRQNQLSGDNNSKILVAGPYDSNTDRWHAYRAQFKISAGN